MVTQTLLTRMRSEPVYITSLSHHAGLEQRFYGGSPPNPTIHLSQARFRAYDQPGGMRTRAELKKKDAENSYNTQKRIMEIEQLTRKNIEIVH